MIWIKKELKIYDCLNSILSENVRKDEFKKPINEGLKDIQTIIIDSYKGFYENQFDIQTKKLNRGIEESRLNKQKSIEEQQRIADDAQRLKDEQIIPAKNRIAEFLQATLNDFEHE